MPKIGQKYVSREEKKIREEKDMKNGWETC